MFFYDYFFHKKMQGLFFFKSGNKYYGDFANGKKEGKGIFVFTDGSWYEGSWKNEIIRG